MRFLIFSAGSSNESYLNHFDLQHDTGELRLVKSIDREVIPEVYLIVNATEYCGIGMYFKSASVP